MEVAAFVDDYDEIATVHNTPASELRSRDGSRGQPVHRWVARDRHAVVATVTALSRPDSRRFLSFLGDPEAIPDLVEAVARRFDSPLHASAEHGSPAAEQLRRTGFETEVAYEEFEVGFATAHRALRRAFPPTGFSVLPADLANPEKLFDLDNEIRSGVRGMEGWVGHWEWFKQELADSAAYLVGVEDDALSYAGLARIWRNDSGPRFGLIGVRDDYRGSMLGPYLLRSVLETAAGWGHQTFTAETAISNPVTHHRLRRLARNSRGVRIQYVRPPR